MTKRVYKAGLPLPLGKSCKGQSLIEFAFVATTFFLLSFALIDFSWLMFSQMNMQDAVREAGRYASTGNHYALNPATPGITLNRIDSITHILNQSAAGTSCRPVISSTPGGVGSAGGPSAIVTIKAICNIPLLTNAIGNFIGNNNQYHFTVSSTFKNEPFSTTQTY